MPTQEQLQWVYQHLPGGLDSDPDGDDSSDAPSGDPNAGDPTQATAPDGGGDSNGAPSGDPDAGDPTQASAPDDGDDSSAATSGDPDAGDPTQASAPDDGDDSSAASSGDPDAGDPTQASAPDDGDDSSSAPSSDPDAGDPTQASAPDDGDDSSGAPSGDPDAGDPTQASAPDDGDDSSAATSGDPDAGDPTQASAPDDGDDSSAATSGDQDAGDPTQGSAPDDGAPPSVDPNSDDPNQSIDPNAPGPNQSMDPNAAGPNQSMDPNADGPNQSIDPNADGPNQSIDPNAAGPNQSIDPNADGPNQSIDPNAAGPNQSIDPNAAGPNQSIDPNAAGPNQSIDPNAAGPNQSIDPNAGGTSQAGSSPSLQPNPVPVGGTVAAPNWTLPNAPTFTPSPLPGMDAARNYGIAAGWVAGYLRDQEIGPVPGVDGDTSNPNSPADAKGPPPLVMFDGKATAINAVVDTTLAVARLSKDLPDSIKALINADMVREQIKEAVVPIEKKDDDDFESSVEVGPHSTSPKGKAETVIEYKVKLQEVDDDNPFSAKILHTVDLSLHLGTTAAESTIEAQLNLLTTELSKPKKAINKAFRFATGHVAVQHIEFKVTLSAEAPISQVAIGNITKKVETMIKSELEFHITKNISVSTEANVGPDGPEGVFKLVFYIN